MRNTEGITARSAALYDPCRRVGPDPRRELPPDFYFQDPIAAALTDYDFAVVFRRVQHVAGLALGAGMSGVDIDRLTALLPHADPTGNRHVGASDVDVIEKATAAFRRQDLATGAGPSATSPSRNCVRCCRY